MHLRILGSLEGISFQPVERFATPDRVFDESGSSSVSRGQWHRELPVHYWHEGEYASAAKLFHIQDG